MDNAPDILALAAPAGALVHMHVGLAVYTGVQLLTRERRASRIGLMAVAAVAPVAALVDLLGGEVSLAGALVNALLTVAWPAILYGVAHHRRQQWEAGRRRRSRRHRTAAAA